MQVDQQVGLLLEYRRLYASATGLSELRLIL